MRLTQLQIFLFAQKAILHAEMTFECAEAIFFLDATNIRVVYNKSIINFDG